MKKLLTYISLLLVLLICGCVHNPYLEPMTIQTAEEVEKIFFENETLFREAAKQIFPYGSDENQLLGIFPTGSEEAYREYNIQMWVYTLDKCIIEVSYPLDDLQCQQIQDVISPLFSHVEMESLHAADGQIRFYLESKSGKTADLFYIENGKRPVTGFGIVEEILIDEYWHALITSD